MEAESEAFAQALQDVEALAQVPLGRYSLWMSAEDREGLQQIDSNDDNDAMAVDENEGEGAAPTLSQSFNSIAASAERWLAAHRAALEAQQDAGAVADSNIGPTDIDPVTAAAQSALWDTVSDAIDQPGRRLCMLIQRSVVRLLAAPMAELLPSAPVAVDAQAATRLYWALLRLPGATSHGLYDSNLLRRAFSAAKRYVELCYGTEAEGGSSGNKNKGATRAKRARKQSEQQVADGAGGGLRRSGRSRSGGAGAASAGDGGDDEDAAAAGADDKDDDDDEAYQDDGGDGDDDDDEDGGRGGKKPTRSSSRTRAAAAAAGGSKGKRGGKRAPSGADDDAAVVVLTSSDRSHLHALLAGLSLFVAQFSLRLHPEFLPMAADVLTASLLLPRHAMQPLKTTTSAAADVESDPTGAASSPLVLASRAALGLLHPRHGSPLTASRVLMKKLKPFLLQAGAGGRGGAVGASLTGSGGAIRVSVQGSAGELDGLTQGAGVAGAGAAGGDDGEDAASDSGVASAAAAMRKIVLPEARVIRSRALYVVKCVMADCVEGHLAAGRLGSRAGTAAGATNGTGHSAIPRSVLGRLPAVAALLQHLATGAANTAGRTSAAAKADLKAYATDVIAVLRSCLPHSLRRAFVRFLTGRLGRSSKVHYRLMAVDVAARLLGAASSGSGAGAEWGGDDVDGEASSASASSSSSAGASDGPSSSSLLPAIALTELPCPSPSEAAEEAEGYGHDVADYAPVEEQQAQEAAAEDEGDDAASTRSGRSRRSSVGSVGSRSAGRSRRRASICVLGAAIPSDVEAAAAASAGAGAGAGGATTPARAHALAAASSGYNDEGDEVAGMLAAPLLAAAAGGSTPDAAAGAGAGKGAARRRSGASVSITSPFYGRLQRADITLGDNDITGLADVTMAPEGDVSGCINPLPTATLLLEFLLHRANDKSPTVRARALAAIASVLDTTTSAASAVSDGAAATGAEALASAAPHVYAMLLSHLAAGSQWAGYAKASAAASSAAGGGDVTMIGDTTLAFIGSNDLNATSVVAGLNATITSSDAALLASNTTRNAGGGGGGGMAGVSAVSTSGPSPLVPLLIRRLEEDKAAVKRGALSALGALALAGGGRGASSVLLLLSSKATRTAAAAAAGHAEVLSQAKSRVLLTSASAPANPSTCLGLYGLQVLASKASDKSLAVRKAALTSLDDLLAAEPGSPVLEQLWLACVLPLVHDPEATVAAAAVGAAHRRITGALVRYSSAQATLARDGGKPQPASVDRAVAARAEATATVGCWALLAGAAANPDLVRCMGRALAMLARTVSGGGSSSSAQDASSGPASASASAAAAAAASSRALGGSTLDRSIQLDVPSLVEGVKAGITACEALGAELGLTSEEVAHGGWMLLELVAAQFLTPQLVAQSAGSGSVPKSHPAAPLLSSVPFLLQCWASMKESVRQLRSQALAQLGAAGEDEEQGAGGGDDDDVTMVDLDTTSSQQRRQQQQQQQQNSAMSDVMVSTASRCLRVLARVAQLVPAADAARLSNELLTSLKRFGWDSQLTSAAIHALAALHGARGEWSSSLLSACQSGLTRYLTVGCSPSIAGSGERSSALGGVACAMLFAVGELATLGLDASSSGEVPVGKGKSAASSSSSSSGMVPIASHLVTLVQALLAPTMSPLDAAAPSSSRPSSSPVAVPPPVRAFAYACLAKLCLRDGDLAKRYVPVFVRDLAAHGGPGAPPGVGVVPAPVRNNILVALGDLCVRYTSLVDRHVPSLAGALGDPSPLVRRHAVVLLSQLVLEDYVKLRGALWYRLAGALADPDAEVRAVAEAAVGGALALKCKATLHAHFVELVFVLTGCSGRPGFSQLLAGEDAAPSASGEPSPAAGSPGLAMPSPARRAAVYGYLLSIMTDEQRLSVHGKLAAEVLGGVAEGSLKISSSAGGGASAVRRAASAPAAAGGATPVVGHLRPRYPGAASHSVGCDLTASMTSAAQAYGPLPGTSASSSSSSSSSSSLIPPGSVSLLLCDTLSLLGCREMRASTSGSGGGSKGGKAAGGGDDEDLMDLESGGAGGLLDGAAAAAAGGNGGANLGLLPSVSAAKARLLARLVRRAVVENVLPLVLGVRAALTSARSPLSASLLGYLKVLLEDHGDDVKGEWLTYAAIASSRFT